MMGNIRFRDFWLGTIGWTSLELFIREMMGPEAFGAMVADRWFPSVVYFMLIGFNVATIFHIATKKEKNV